VILGYFLVVSHLSFAKKVKKFESKKAFVQALKDADVEFYEVPNSAVIVHEPGDKQFRYWKNKVKIEEFTSEGQFNSFNYSANAASVFNSLSDTISEFKVVSPHLVCVYYKNSYTLIKDEDGCFFFNEPLYQVISKVESHSGKVRFAKKE
jgi:hypothetical protein